MGIDSRLIDLSLCCIICSQIKKIMVFVAKPDVQIACHPNKRQSLHVPPPTTATAPRGLRIAEMSGQFSWSRRVAVCTHEKSQDCGDFEKSALCGLYQPKLLAMLKNKCIKYEQLHLLN